MTRRIVRTLTQLCAAAAFTLVVVYLLDRNYRVLPNAIHTYMPSHHAGLLVTDVTVVTCSSIKPFSSCGLDPSKWHRIDKELYLGKTWASSAYMYVRRKREEDLTEDDRIVMDVSVGEMNPDHVHKAGEEWESRPAGLWLKRSSSKLSPDSSKAVTDLDVIFGDDATEARAGWGLVGGPLDIGTGKTLHSVHVTVRRGPPRQPKKPKLRIPDTGRFKIMQIADLHLSTGVGECREAVPDSYKGGKCQADPRTLDFVNRILDDEKPDMVVLSGDQVNGDTAPDAPSAIYKIASLLIKRKIPYVAIFGNHDDEKTMSREAQMAIMETLPYSLSTAGPVEVDGVGNYYVEVLARGHSDHSALTIYLLDTHAYSSDERKYPGYDWLKPSQIDWFKKTVSSLKKNHEGYTHRHMDIAFIHIPMTEYADYTLPRLGEWREGVTAPIFNSGFRDALAEQGIVMVSAGHDHVNDYCSLASHGDKKITIHAGEVIIPPDDKDAHPDGIKKTPALWMCYAGGVGFGGYAGYGGYTRRVRLFEVDTEEARIKTWKRLEDGDIGKYHDMQIIVDGGKAYLQTADPPPAQAAVPPPVEEHKPEGQHNQRRRRRDKNA